MSAPSLQYENAREAEMLTRISPEALGAELRHMAKEPNAADLMHALEEEKLVSCTRPRSPDRKLNLAVLRANFKRRGRWCPSDGTCA